MRLQSNRLIWTTLTDTGTSSQKCAAPTRLTDHPPPRKATATATDTVSVSPCMQTTCRAQLIASKRANNVLLVMPKRGSIAR
jgi:hypothetical protein